jgi:hypothetical protein
LLGLNNNNFYYKKAQLSDYYFINMNLSILLVLMINQYLPSCTHENKENIRYPQYEAGQCMVCMERDINTLSVDNEKRHN